MSEQVELYKALLKFQSSISNIQKDSTNPHFKNRFASLCAILDGINDALNAAGLVVMQHPVGDSELVKLKTTVIHAVSGQGIESEFSMVPAKKDPQGIGSCITYMRRYALTAILKLNVDDDDDGNAASNTQQKKVMPVALGDGVTAESIKKDILASNTFDELSKHGQRARQLEKNQVEHEMLTKAYKDRMAFLRGEE